MDDLLDQIPGEEKTERKPTICLDCRYMQDPRAAANACCANPRFEISPTYDYVTGKITNGTKPRCRDVNVDGQCPGFEERNRVLVSDVLCGTLVIAAVSGVIAFMVMKYWV